MNKDPFTLLMAAVVLAAWLIIGTVAILCAVSSAVLRRLRGADDIEALIEATREDIPDYVPDEWVKNI